MHWHLLSSVMSADSDSFCVVPPMAEGEEGTRVAVCVPNLSSSYYYKVILHGALCVWSLLTPITSRRPLPKMIIFGA
jgi:hypothetical protein